MQDKDKVRIKSKKKRSPSSRQWLERQLNDPFVHEAKIQGYRSRAAFKLEEIHKKYNLFQKANIIVDLGAAPGGWTQIVKKIKPHAKTIALDIQEFEPIDGTIQIIGDVTENKTLEELSKHLKDQKVDIVLSDMAAPACGVPSVDHDRIMILLEIVIDFGMTYLSSGGHLVAKVLRGGAEAGLLNVLKTHFKKIHHFKPKSSRQESAEMYIVALDFKGPKV